MKKCISIMMFCLMISGVYAQKRSTDLEVKWGQTIKINKKHLFEDIITIDNDNQIHILYREYGKLIGPTSKYHVARISESLNYIPGKPLELRDGERPLKLHEVVEMNGSIYLFSFYTDTKTKEKFIFLHKYNLQTQSVSPAKEIARINYEGKRIGYTGSFTVVFSEDRSSVMVYYDLPVDPKDNERFGAIAFNSEMEILWKNEFELPYHADKFILNQLFLGNNGELFLIGRKFLEKDPGVRRDPKNFQYVLLHSANQGNDLIEHIISLENYYITDLTASMTPANDIICAGFISERQRSSSIKGVFYIKINDRSKEIEIEKIKIFDYEFITEGMTEKQQKKTDKNLAKGKNIEMPDFEFRDIIMKENGGALLTAEQFYISIVTTTDPRTGATSSTYYYYYNDIIVVDLNPDGTINWTAKIPKKQVSTNDGGFYSSFLMAVRNDNIYLLYNDHIANVNIPNGPQKFVSTRSKKNIATVVVTIDGKGNWKKEMLFTAAETKINFLPKSSMQLSDNEILLYCYARGSNKFGKATIK